MRFCWYHCGMQEINTWLPKLDILQSIFLLSDYDFITSGTKFQFMALKLQPFLSPKPSKQCTCHLHNISSWPGLFFLNPCVLPARITGNRAYTNANVISSHFCRCLFKTYTPLKAHKNNFVFTFSLKLNNDAAVWDSRRREFHKKGQTSRRPCLLCSLTISKAFPANLSVRAG